MAETSLITELLGPLGGAVGVGMVMGSSLTLAFTKKNVISVHLERINQLEEDYRSRISQMREDFQRQDDECKSRVTFLEERVRELEQDRFERAIKRE